MAAVLRFFANIAALRRRRAAARAAFCSAVSRTRRPSKVYCGFRRMVAMSLAGEGGGDTRASVIKLERYTASIFVSMAASGLAQDAVPPTEFKLL